MTMHTSFSTTTYASTTSNDLRKLSLLDHIRFRERPQCARCGVLLGAIRLQRNNHLLCPYCHGNSCYCCKSVIVERPITSHFRPKGLCPQFGDDFDTLTIQQEQRRMADSGEKRTCVWGMGTVKLGWKS